MPEQTTKQEETFEVTCYDCEETHNYTDDDVVEYFDAVMGWRTSVVCKCCGLTNSW